MKRFEINSSGRRHLPLHTAYNTKTSTASSHFNHSGSVYPHTITDRYIRSGTGEGKQITYCIISLLTTFYMWSLIYYYARNFMSNMLKCQSLVVHVQPYVNWLINYVHHMNANVPNVIKIVRYLIVINHFTCLFIW